MPLWGWIVLGVVGVLTALWFSGLLLAVLDELRSINTTIREVSRPKDGWFL